MIAVEVFPFRAEHAELCVDLAARAFAAVSERERSDQPVELIGNLLGSSNPAGPSLLAVARAGGHAVGMVAATPMRFRGPGRPPVTGHQIGYLFVDRASQRRGVGRRVVSELTAALRSRADAFTYTFPNRRSIGVFDRLGYERLGSIPTYVIPPRPLARGRVDAGPLRELGIEAVRERVAAAPDGPPSGDGFVRDAAYFAWRFTGPGAAGRYRFVACGRGGERSETILAFASHRFRGVRFAILLDAYFPAGRPDLAHALYAARGALRTLGAGLLYVNTNAHRLASERSAPGGLPLAVRVPALANPRPVTLLMHPETGAIEPSTLGRSLVMTADWMGF